MNIFYAKKDLERYSFDDINILAKYLNINDKNYQDKLWNITFKLYKNFKGHMDSETEEICPGCSEPIKKEDYTSCGHPIHGKCLQKACNSLQMIHWKERKLLLKECTCPFCRQIVSIKPDLFQGFFHEFKEIVKNWPTEQIKRNKILEKFHDLLFESNYVNRNDENRAKNLLKNFKILFNEKFYSKTNFLNKLKDEKPLFEKNTFQEIGENLKKEADKQGTAEAQYKYALYLFENEDNIQEAGEYFKKAADQGLAEAQYKYALYIFENEDNLQESNEYLKKAADQGLAEAQFSYAKTLYNGMGGVSEDLPQAREYFKKAADQGFYNAQHMYARMLYDGKGGPQDLPQAREYYKNMANNGRNYSVIYTYANMLYNGLGGSQDLPQSATYFKIIADKYIAQDDEESENEDEESENEDEESENEESENEESENDEEENESGNE